MSKGNRASKINVKSVGQIVIQPATVNEWLLKNKQAQIEVKEKSLASSDCSRPWG